MRFTPRRVPTPTRFASNSGIRTARPCCASRPPPGQGRCRRRGKHTPPPSRAEVDMDFAYSPEQEAWRSALRSFLDDHGAVNAARALQEAGVDHDPQFWQRIGQLGLHGLHIDEKSGGQGATVEELAVTM